MGGQPGADFFIVILALPYDPSQLGQSVFNNAHVEAVVLFEKWKKRLAAVDLDIHLYDYMAWEKERVLAGKVDPRVRQVIDLVNEMRAEVLRNDIFFDVIQMLRRDTSLVAEVEAVFEEARRVADELGVELKLSAVTPGTERKCDFVTGGSSFVSWDGGVQPCYLPVAPVPLLHQRLEPAGQTQGVGPPEPAPCWRSGTTRTFTLSGATWSLSTIPTAPTAGWLPATWCRTGISSITASPAPNRAGPASGTWGCCSACSNSLLTNPAVHPYGKDEAVGDTDNFLRAGDAQIPAGLVQKETGADAISPHEDIGPETRLQGRDLVSEVKILPGIELLALGLRHDLVEEGLVLLVNDGPVKDRLQLARTAIWGGFPGERCRSNPPFSFKILNRPSIFVIV